MKFDPNCWQEVKANEQIQFGKGVLRLRASVPAPLYITTQGGHEALCAVATAFDVELSEEVSFRVEGAKGTRVFLFKPLPTFCQPKGEVFTNIDRMPDESGQMLEVRKALRQLEIERRATLREIRAERERLLAVRAPASEPEPESDLQALAKSLQDDNSDKDEAEA